MRGPHAPVPKSPNQTDQDWTASGVIVFWTHTTVPPAPRVAPARRLTAGTISRAFGVSAGWPGAMKPFCRSTTTSAVRAGSIVSNGWSRPRRWSARSMAWDGIAILCMALASSVGVECLAAQRPEEFLHLARQGFRLFHRGEMAAARHRAPAADVGIGARRQRARRPQDLAREFGIAGRH